MSTINMGAIDSILAKHGQDKQFAYDMTAIVARLTLEIGGAITLMMLRMGIDLEKDENGIIAAIISAKVLALFSELMGEVLGDDSAST